jgi:hypothetical protein
MENRLAVKTRVELEVSSKEKDSRSRVDRCHLYPNENSHQKLRATSMFWRQPLRSAIEKFIQLKVEHKCLLKLTRNTDYNVEMKIIGRGCNGR